MKKFYKPIVTLSLILAIAALLINVWYVGELLHRLSTLEQEHKIEIQQTPLKFQDKMSMDWGAEDGELLLKFAEWISPEDCAKEVKAWNILAVLNRMLDTNYPGTISEVIQQELKQYGMTLEELQNVEVTEITVEAMELVMLDKWDETAGSVVFQKRRY